MDCGNLTDPANGQASHTAGTTFGQTATYSCNTGYNLVGDSSSTCQDTGNWSGSASTCQGVLLYYPTCACEQLEASIRCRVHSLHMYICTDAQYLYYFGPCALSECTSIWKAVQAGCPSGVHDFSHTQKTVEQAILEGAASHFCHE